MSENDMKELQPGQGMAALAATPQSAELNAGERAGREGRGGNIL